MKPLTLIAAAAVVLSFSGLPASAASCTKSCTSLRDGCIKGGGNPAACSAGYADCKKTGTYAGMPSGRIHKNICKK